MNYEKVMIELLSRIQVLEEQVAELMNQKETTAKKGEDKMSTLQIREFIEAVKEKAKGEGKTSIALISGEIHKELGLKSSMPMVCNAMRQCMQAGDVVLHTTPKGQSSTIEIEYYL